MYNVFENVFDYSGFLPVQYSREMLLSIFLLVWICSLEYCRVIGACASYDGYNALCIDDIKPHLSFLPNVKEAYILPTPEMLLEACNIT